MTITPMPVLPAAPRGSASRAADAKPAKAADDFAAVLDGQLNGAKTARKAVASKEHPASPDASSSDVPSADAQAAAAQPSAVPTAGLPVAPVEPLLAGLPTAAPATTTAAPSADGAADATGTTANALPGVATATGIATATPTHTTADPATPHLALPPAGEPKAQPESAAADPATPHQPTPPTEPLPDLAVVTTVAKVSGVKAPAAPVTAEQPEPSSAAPAAAGVAAPATPATEAPAAGPAQPVAPSPVLAQVTPALARVVTRGDGEHRMMLKLHPADLGEIHLTVTVRGEHVDVEIAAGAQARDVLRDGSSHLRSLLESIGRSTGQLVLRDLPSTPAQPSHGAGLDTGAQQDGRGTSYAGTGDSRRDRSDTGAGPQPPTAEQPHDRPVPTRPASLRTTVPGASALDVTV